MSILPSGIYTIAKDNAQLSLEDHNEGALVYIVPSGDSDWKLETQSNSNVTIRDPETSKFLGFAESPHVNGQIIIEANNPIEWQLRQSPRPGFFFIVIPGGPVDGQELALDNSLIRVFPPRAALRPLDQSAIHQAWNLQSRQ